MTKRTKWIGGLAVGPRTPVKSYIRRYSDTGQTRAYVEWSDGSRTEGSHKDVHMRALMDHADALGCQFEHQVW